MIKLALLLFTLLVHMISALYTCTNSENISATFNNTIIVNYNFDGSSAGLSEPSNMYPGTVSGDVKIVDGIFGKAVEFGPSCGEISVPGLSGYNWGNNFTLSMYVSKSRSGGKQGLISNGFCQTGSFEIRFPDSSFSFYGAAVTTKTPYCLLDTTSILSSNIWYHLVLTYNGQTLDIYQDGVRKSSVTKRDRGPLDIINKPLLIGKVINAQGVAECFQGKIDDISIYKVYASAADVKGLACFKNRGRSIANN